MIFNITDTFSLQEFTDDLNELFTAQEWKVTIGGEEASRRVSLQKGGIIALLFGMRTKISFTCTLRDNLLILNFNNGLPIERIAVLILGCFCLLPLLVTSATGFIMQSIRYPSIRTDITKLINI